jgi:hypothetical protein
VLPKTGTWREGFFTGHPEGYIKQGSGNKYFFPLATTGEPGGEIRFPGISTDSKR